MLPNNTEPPFDIYLEESDDFSDRLNNIQNFNSWCSERMLSLDRKYAKEICNCLGIPQPFSDKEICFARAKYVDIWCMNHDIEFSDVIYQHKQRFDMMNLADYLVGNSDEHSENWGVV